MEQGHSGDVAEGMGSVAFLRSHVCWDEDDPREECVAMDELSVAGSTAHFGGIFVEKRYRLPPGAAGRTYNGRVVHQGNSVKYQDGEWGIFQVLVFCPLAMPSSKVADSYSLLEGHRSTGRCRDGLSANGLRRLGDVGGASS